MMRSPGFTTRFVMALLMMAMSGPSLHGQTTLEDFSRRAGILADSAQIPGGAVVVVLDGEVVATEVFGVTEADGPPVNADTPFRIGSVSKVFTATAVARLVAEGRLRLDEDLRSGHDWLRAAAPGSEPVTLVQLLTHSGGFDDRAVGMFAAEVGDVRPLGEYLADQMPLRTTAPGRWARYSNQGAALAGLMVEEGAGQPFADAVESLVLSPAGMSSSSFQQPIPDELRQRMARAYRCVPGECDPMPLDYRHTTPAGALVTTPADMGRFIMALLDGEALGAGTTEVLFARHWGARTDLPGLALAFQEQSLAGHRGLVHAGSTSGYLSLLVVVPELHAGLFIVASGGSSRLGTPLVDAFTELLPEATQPFMVSDAVPEPLSEEDAAEYVGAYLLTRAPRGSYESFPTLFLYSQTLWADEDGYLVRVESGVRRQYGRLDGDLFGSADGVGRLAFERDSQGRVTSMHAPEVFYGARFPGSSEKLAKWAAPSFMNELLSWAVALPVLAILLWALVQAGGFVRGVMSADAKARRAARPPRSWSVVAGLVLTPVHALLIGYFVLKFMARFNAIARQSPEVIAYGLPPELYRLLWMPWAIAAASLGITALMGWSWVKGEGRLWDRLLFTTVALCSILFVFLLHHFHFLPPVA